MERTRFRPDAGSQHRPCTANCPIHHASVTSASARLAPEASKWHAITYTGLPGGVHNHRTQRSDWPAGCTGAVGSAHEDARCCKGEARHRIRRKSGHVPRSVAIESL